MRGGYKGILKSTEVNDIYKRIVTKYGDASLKIEANMRIKLPRCMESFIGHAQVYKIEWMYNGYYEVFCSDRYAENIIHGCEIKTLASKYKICPKFVDYCGANIPDIHFKLWSESLFSPTVCSEMKVVVYWKTMSVLSWARLKVMSWVGSYNSIITVTIVFREEQFIM